MALFRYLRPVGDSSHGSVSQSVPHGVLAKVNKEIARSVEKRGGRQGSYLSVSAEKAQVATYISTHSVRAAIKHFSKAFGKDLKENTVRDWVKAYKKELQRKRSVAEIGDDLLVTELLCKKRGRPHLLKESVDAEVQAIIRSMRDGGAVVNTSITIAVATGVVRKRDRFSLKENGGSLELTKSWAKSLLHRMGFVKRRGNTKCKVSVECFEALKSQFLEMSRRQLKCKRSLLNLSSIGIRRDLNSSLCNLGRWSKEDHDEWNFLELMTSDKSQLCLLPLPLVIFCLSNSSTKARLRDVCLTSLFQLTGTSLSHPTSGLTSKR